MNNFAKNSELQKLFVNELKGIYWLETNWIVTQTELEEIAASEELKVTLRTHNLLNMEAATRLNRVFELLELSYVPREYEFVGGLVKDIRRQLVTTDAESMVRDAAVIINVQKVMHYAIASYGSLATLANLLALTEIHDLLQLCLHDKKVNDVELTALAENYTNLRAVRE